MSADGGFSLRGIRLPAGRGQRWIDQGLASETKLLAVGLDSAAMHLHQVQHQGQGNSEPAFGTTARVIDRGNADAGRIDVPVLDVTGDYPVGRFHISLTSLDSSTQAMSLTPRWGAEHATKAGLASVAPVISGDAVSTFVFVIVAREPAERESGPKTCWSSYFTSNSLA